MPLKIRLTFVVCVLAGGLLLLCVPGEESTECKPAEQLEVSESIVEPETTRRLATESKAISGMRRPEAANATLADQPWHNVESSSEEDSNQTDPATIVTIDQMAASRTAVELESESESESESEPESEPERETGESKAWPELQFLIDQARSFESQPEISQLAIKIVDDLTQLQMASELGDPASFTRLRSLEQSSYESQQLALHLWRRSHSLGDEQLAETASQLSRFAYQLVRRQFLWQQVQSLAGAVVSQPADKKETELPRVRIKIDAIDSKWSEYLKLDDLKTEFDEFEGSEIRRRNAARQTLARIHSPLLNEAQSNYVRQVVDPELVSFLKRVAHREVDYPKFLADVEAFESHPSAIREFVLNDHYQNLLWSADPGHRELANELDTHYRNANFRVSVSGELLNRFLPAVPDSAEPFSDQIMGANVRGQNHVSNRLNVDLVPDPSHVHLRLGTVGHVDSNSVARRDGFTIRSHGEAEFQVYKKVLLGIDGFDVSEPPVAYSDASQRVVGLESKLDPIPLVGLIARRVAEKKIRQQAPETERMVKSRVANDASDRVHELVSEEVQKLRRDCITNLLQPLMALDLEPEPVQMATTDNQIVMRYRLAGRDQMAANTPRPADNGQHALSFQLHQSAINNFVARLDLGGNRFSTQQLMDHLQQKLGLEINQDPDTPDSDAEFEFERFDPLRVEFTDDRINITMNLNSLRLGQGTRWRKVSLTASYAVEIEGAKLQLLQDDEGKRIKGYRLRFRDRAPIGTVHQVLFKRDYTINAVPKQLTTMIDADQMKVAQLMLEDGWLGLAMDYVAAEPIDSRPVSRATRAFNFGPQISR